MIKERFANLEIIYDEKYIEEKDMVINNYEPILCLINDLWGFKLENEVRIYIVKSELKFFFHSYPLINKILLFSILFPIWYSRERNTWKTWAGINNNKSKIPSMYLKPIEAYKNNNTVIGKSIYRKNSDDKEKFKNIFCQLLVKLSYKSSLPVWIDAGISMVTNYYYNKQKVRNDSIELFNKDIKYKEIVITDYHINNIDAIVYNYVKGYWTVRYLEENHPGFLKEIFRKSESEKIVKQIAKKMDLNIDNSVSFWEELDNLLYKYFKNSL